VIANAAFGDRLSGCFFEHQAISRDLHAIARPSSGRIVLLPPAPPPLVLIREKNAVTAFEAIDLAE
jgi:hypothetical protein